MSKVNLNELEWQTSEQGDFAFARKSLSNAAGGELLGASVFRVEPGKRAFPFHSHQANEEAMLILSGAGSLRLGKEVLSVKQDDYIALKRGNTHAHQLINDSNEPLVYLCFSTMITPEVMEYPDSNKIGLMAGSAPGGHKNERSIKKFYHQEDDVAYLDRE